MKILLIGPCPPPHGGISVHVSGIQRRLKQAGVVCEVLDSNNAARAGFAARLAQYVWGGWTLHVHINGHNWTSWALAMECGLAGKAACGRILTVHSGMTPAYLANGSRWAVAMARCASRLYQTVVCVSQEIRDALLPAGAHEDRLRIAPAYLGAEWTRSIIDPGLTAWMETRRPLLSTALFFRPEYGFDVLLNSLAELRSRYHSFGCLVMGGGEMPAEARQRVRELGLERHLRSPGDVDHDVCLEAMSRSDVFVRPTLADGDSISVREAVSLGVPVVASRTGTRPPGVRLFNVGDSADMTAQIEAALASPRQDKPPLVGSMNRLLEIYQQIAPREESLVSA